MAGRNVRSFQSGQCIQLARCLHLQACCRWPGSLISVCAIRQNGSLTIRVGLLVCDAIKANGCAFKLLIGPGVPDSGCHASCRRYPAFTQCKNPKKIGPKIRHIGFAER